MGVHNIINTSTIPMHQLNRRIQNTQKKLLTENLNKTFINLKKRNVQCMTKQNNNFIKKLEIG